jgi:hypothetical protein
VGDSSSPRQSQKSSHATILQDFSGAYEMQAKTGFLAGKKLLITGVLSNRSIAYGIARACHAQGAELAFSYQGERFKERITEFAADFGSNLVFDCDVSSDVQIARLGQRTMSLFGPNSTVLCTPLVLRHEKPLPVTS